MVCVHNSKSCVSIHVLPQFNMHMWAYISFQQICLSPELGHYDEHMSLKCPWHEIFYLIRKSFQSDEEWRLFQRDSTLGCRLIQDFDLCKLDECDVTKGTQSGAKSQKIDYLSRLFLYRTETQYSCYAPHKVPWYVHCEISMATQWAPGPLHSKGKIKVFLLQEVLFDLVVHSVGVSEHGHYKAEAQGSLLNSRATNKAVFILGR